MVILFVAFTVATLLAYVAGDRSAPITAWRRGLARVSSLVCRRRRGSSCISPSSIRSAGAWTW